MPNIPDTISISSFLVFCATFAGIWAGYKLVMEIIKEITSRHDKKQELEEAAIKIKTMKDELMKEYKEDQQKKWAEYDKEVSEIRAMIKDNHDDSISRFNLIREEQKLNTEVLFAILQGLHQQGCNGPVTEAQEKLAKHLNIEAHKVS